MIRKQAGFTDHQVDTRSKVFAVVLRDYKVSFVSRTVFLRFALNGS